MPGLAVLGTIADTSARAHVLHMNGDDLDVTGQNGASYMVPIESIEVEEQGPGGISSMSFSIRDPDRLITPVAMADVEFWDQVADLPIFRGFVQSWSMRGIVERWIDIQCIGCEVLLDWMIMERDLTFAALSKTAAGIQGCVANATGMGVALRAFSSSTNQGTQARPLGDLGLVVSINEGILANAVTVTAGMSLREAIRQLTDETIDSGAASKVSGDVVPKVTVDFWLGLRAWNDKPTDYDDLTVVDTVGAGIAATILDYDTDAAGVVRGVYVTGGNAAGTGLVTDGSGKPGPIATLDDSTILTTAKRDSVAIAYLSEHGVATRGSLTLERFTASANIRAGSRVVITNTQAGLSATPFVIASITKRFFVVVKPI